MCHKITGKRYRHVTFTFASPPSEQIETVFFCCTPFFYYRPCLVSTFCEKIFVYMPSFVWGRRAMGFRFHMGALLERALKNNEVFRFLYFYSSKKIPKFFAFCIFIVVQLRFQLELQLEVRLELELETKLDDSGFPKPTATIQLGLHNVK